MAKGSLLSSPHQRSSCVVLHLLVFTSHLPHIMTAEIFTRDGVKIRRLKSGHCVREDEWKQFVEINEVRSSPCFGCGISDIGLDLVFIIYVKERTVRGASSAIHTRPKTWSLPSQIELWSRDPQRIYPVSSGGPRKQPRKPRGTQHYEEFFHTPDFSATLPQQTVRSFTRGGDHLRTRPLSTGGARARAGNELWAAGSQGEGR